MGSLLRDKFPETLLVVLQDRGWQLCPLTECAPIRRQQIPNRVLPGQFALDSLAAECSHSFSRLRMIEEPQNPGGEIVDLILIVGVQGRFSRAESSFGP